MSRSLGSRVSETGALLRLRVKSLIATTAVVVSGQVFLAQQPAVDEAPLFRSAVSDLVVIAATVLDRDGGFVEGLGQSSFRVYDNGKPQEIRFFSNEVVPVSVGLIIDSSGSMRSRMGDVIAASVSFARLSDPRDELFALAFNDRVHELLPGRRFWLSSDLDTLQRAVATIRPQGRTSLYDAIVAGLDRLAEGSRARKVLIVMSDGADNASRHSLDEVLDRARRSDATIYTIGLFDADDPDRNPGVLQKLAVATGGERFLPGSAGPLLQASRRVARDIRSAYTLAFEPSQSDGKYHELKVEADGSDRRRLKIRTRPGYVAATVPEAVKP